MTTPYTYLIGWPEHHMWYYGVRWRPNCDPSDLWVKYFTSSKYVKAFRLQHGEPSIIQIRKTFTEPAKARAWENRVLCKIKADVNEIFLNKSINTTPSMQGRKHSEETKRKIRESNLGLKRSDKTRENISKAHLKKYAEGFTESKETRLKKSLSHLGIAKSLECRANTAKSKIGRKHWINHETGEGKSTYECPGPGFVLGKKDKRKKEAEASF